MTVENVLLPPMNLIIDSIWGTGVDTDNPNGVIGAIMQWPETTVVTGASFYAYSTTLAVGAYEVAVTKVDTGFPSGGNTQPTPSAALYSVGASAQVVGAPGPSHVEVSVTFPGSAGNGFEVTEGDFFGFTLKPSGTGSVSNFRLGYVGRPNNPIFPYTVSHNGTSWSDQSNDPLVIFGKADGTYIKTQKSYGVPENSNYKNNANPYGYGTRITMPFDAVFKGWYARATDTMSCYLHLCSDDNGVPGTNLVSLNRPISYSQATGYGYFLASEKVNLTKGETYHIVYMANGSTNQAGLNIVSGKGYDYIENMAFLKCTSSSSPSAPTSGTWTESLNGYGAIAAIIEIDRAGNDKVAGSIS